MIWVETAVPLRGVGGVGWVGARRLRRGDNDGLTLPCPMGLAGGSFREVGRRAGCHTFCWMAPFMILGRKLRNVFAWPSLRLQSDPQRCSDCMTCTHNCAMSLDVNAMVKAGAMEHSECILCGKCVDGCPSKAIQYVFRAGK